MSDLKISTTPRTLLVFVDETGHEHFSDKNAPFFGLGACALPVLWYEQHLNYPWAWVENAFPADLRPLHACKLRPSNVTTQQLNCINDFFMHGEFARLAVVAPVSFRITGDDPPSVLSICVGLLAQQIAKTANKLRGDAFDEILVLVSHSQRLEKELSAELECVRIVSADGKHLNRRTMHIPSSEDFAGLRVADFIAHTAGRAARMKFAGRDYRLAKDFRHVFVNPRSEFLCLSHAVVGDAALSA